MNTIATPTRTSLLELTRKAGRGAHYHLAPRYTGGSPALVPMGVCLHVALQEFEARDRCLTGVFGEELKARAETAGLAGIAYGRWEARGQVWRLDLLTGEVFVEPKRLTWEERDRVRDLRNIHTHCQAHGWALEKSQADELAALEHRLTLHGETVN